jgi:zinc protease
VVQLSDGAKIYWFPSERVPVFSATITFHRGANSDPDGLSGLSVLSANLITRGHAGKDEAEVARLWDDLASGISVNVSEERTDIGVFGLNEALPNILDALFDTLLKPDFTVSTFSRIKKNYLDSLQQLGDSPSATAMRAMHLLLYDGYRNQRPISGLKSEIEQIQVHHLKQWWAGLLSTRPMTVFLYGGQQRKDVLGPFIKRFIDFQSHRFSLKPVAQSWASKTFVPRKKYNLQGHQVFVHKAGLKDAVILQGFLGPNAKDPHFYGLEIAETIFGGTFDSLLTESLRVRLGLTYAVSAGFQYDENESLFILSTSTTPKKFEKLYQALSEQWRKFLEHRYTASQLSAAILYMTGSFPVTLADPYNSAVMFYNRILQNYPENFLDRYTEGLKQVDMSQVRAAIDKHFKNKKITTVIVGDEKAVFSEKSQKKSEMKIMRVQDFL